MNKWIKWLVILLIGMQIINYFFVKQQVPKRVISQIEGVGCDGYEIFGMHLPFNYLINTETDAIVYLTHPTASNVDLKVNLINPTIPLFKGFFSFRYRIATQDQIDHFSYCAKKSSG